MILHAGRPDPHKGADVLLAAVKKIDPQIRDRMTVVIAGYGADEKKALNFLARGLHSLAKTGANVVFLGRCPVEDMPDLYAAADMFVLPTWREGFGLVNIEAMAAGTPVISTRIDAVLEVLTHSFDGLLVPPRDPVRLAEEMTAVVKEPGLAVRLVREGRRTVEKKFTLDVVADQVERLYLEGLQAKEGEK